MAADHGHTMTGSAPQNQEFIILGKWGSRGYKLCHGNDFHEAKENTSNLSYAPDRTRSTLIKFSHFNKFRNRELEVSKGINLIVEKGLVAFRKPFVDWMGTKSGDEVPRDLCLDSGIELYHSPWIEGKYSM